MLPAFDWFHDKPPFDADVLVTPCWDGMDRLNGGRFDDANAAALFEVVMATPSTKTLDKIVLRNDLAEYDNERTRFHLFAITGLRQR